MKRLEELGISPTPWHIKDGTDVPCMKCEHGEIPLVDAYGSFENVNDVYLITAAPDMYESLREAVELRCGNCDGREYKPEYCLGCRVLHWKAALEKAGGAE